MTGFQRLCLVTAGVIFILIVVGGVVRATDSGLGCPDWPTCHGKLIPSGDKHTIIEYSHRLTATISGILGASLMIWAFRKYRHIPSIFYITCAGFVLGVTQAALGGAVVKNELPSSLVAIHLTIALSILTLLVLLAITVSAIEGKAPVQNVTRGFGRMALAASIGTLLLIIVGAYVTGEGYGLACSGWPLCNGEVVPSADATSVQVHFLHRFLALIVGLTILGLVFASWKKRAAAPLAFKLSALAFAIFLVQALIGAANVWTELADEVDAAHLGVATLLWTVLAVLNIYVHRIYAILPSSTSERPQTGLAGMPR